MGKGALPSPPRVRASTESVFTVEPRAKMQPAFCAYMSLSITEQLKRRVIFYLKQIDAGTVDVWRDTGFGWRIAGISRGQCAYCWQIE